MRLGGKLQWMHVNSMRFLTHLVWHAKRGYQALEGSFLFCMEELIFYYLAFNDLPFDLGDAPEEENGLPFYANPPLTSKVIGRDIVLTGTPTTFSNT